MASVFPYSYITLVIQQTTKEEKDADRITMFPKNGINQTPLDGAKPSLNQATYNQERQQKKLNSKYHH